MDLKSGVAAVGVAVTVGIAGVAAVKAVGASQMDTVTCEYVRRVDGQVAGYVFYAGPGLKAMTGQAVMASPGAGSVYVVGESYSVADSKLVWTFGNPNVR